MHRVEGLRGKVGANMRDELEANVREWKVEAASLPKGHEGVVALQLQVDRGKGLH